MKKVQNPKNKLNLKFKHAKFILAFIAFGFLGCAGGGGVGDGLKCGNGNWAQLVESDLNKFFDAASAYSNNPTTENCQRYKSAGQDYINALNKIKKCVPKAGLIGFNQAIDAARNEFNNISC